MMKRKKLLFLIISCIIVLFACGLFLFLNRQNGYYASGVCAADAIKYEETDEVGYLTILFYIGADVQREMVLQVTDEELKDKLSGETLENIIGINFILDVPSKKLRENHMKKAEIKDVLALLKDNTFDDCLFLKGYSTDS